MRLRRYINRPPSVAYPAPVPNNFDMIFFGDSRTENGIAANLNSTGYATNLRNAGVAGQIGPMSGHRLRVAKFSNFGISGATSMQAAFDPRQNASNTVTTGTWWRGTVGDTPTSSGSDNKSISSAVAHSAGIVCLLLGTNDGATNWPANSRTAMTTIINGLTAGGKVVILLNETPRGINTAGSTQSNLTVSDAAAFKAYSDWLSKWDYASGDALSNPKVIVVDSWSEFLNTGSGTNYYNKQGYLHDGLHFTPYGAKRLAQIIVNKLSTVWVWAARPVRISLPTTNGLSSISTAAPFLNSNAIFTPGTNGTISGTWSTAPTAATVAQGWTLTGSSVSTFVASAEKGVETDPDGYPVQKVVVTSGSMANNATSTVTLQQNVTVASVISAGMVSITSKLRAMARVKIDAGSNLLSGVSVAVTVNPATATGMLARTMTVTSFLPLNGGGVDMGDGQWYDYLTEIIDLAEANMTASPGNISSITSISLTVVLQFDNRTGSTASPSATVRVARAGVSVVSS